MISCRANSSVLRAFSCSPSLVSFCDRSSESCARFVQFLSQWPRPLLCRFLLFDFLLQNVDALLTRCRGVVVPRAGLELFAAVAAAAVVGAGQIARRSHWSAIHSWLLSLQQARHTSTVEKWSNLAMGSVPFGSTTSLLRAPSSCLRLVALLTTTHHIGP